MKIFGAITFLAGMFVFMSGWIFLDLASLPLKQDLYALDVLGFFNQLFSLDPRTASFQSILSTIFILMGCAICYAGTVMIKQR